MKIVESFSQGLSGKIVLTILAAVIILHLGVMAYYLQDNRIERQAARRDEVIQKIINAIYLVQATPIENRKHAVAAMDDSVLTVSLTETPKYNLQFTTVSFWAISHALRQRPSQFLLSIKLYEMQWLNINATIYSHMFLTQLLLIGFEALVFSIIFLFVFSINRFIEPLKHFKLAAERLGIDLHSKPVHVIGPPVVQEAVTAMNEMQERIQGLIRDRTLMLAAISHDLRTPITRMKIRAQFLEDESVKHNFVYDLDEMEKMIAETLSFAREDSKKEKSVNIELISLLESLCDDMCEMGYDVSFETTLHREPILARPIALKRAFTNIINNGIRYGKRVRVTLTRKYKHLVIHFDDDGPGIAARDIQRVFDPFYRGETSRSRNTGGSGLGLSVAKDIITAHGGRITLQNRREGGLRVLILF